MESGRNEDYVSKGFYFCAREIEERSADPRRKKIVRAKLDQRFVPNHLKIPQALRAFSLKEYLFESEITLKVLSHSRN